MIHRPPASPLDTRIVLFVEIILYRPPPPPVPVNPILLPSPVITLSRPSRRLYMLDAYVRLYSLERKG